MAVPTEIGRSRSWGGRCALVTWICRWWFRQQSLPSSRCSRVREAFCVDLGRTILATSSTMRVHGDWTALAVPSTGLHALSIKRFSRKATDFSVWSRGPPTNSGVKASECVLRCSACASMGPEMEDLFLGVHVSFCKTYVAQHRSLVVPCFRPAEYLPLP